MHLDIGLLEKTIEPKVPHRFLRLWKTFVVLLTNATMCALTLAALRAFEILYSYLLIDTHSSLLTAIPIHSLTEILYILIAAVYLFSVILTVVGFSRAGSSDQDNHARKKTNNMRDNGVR